LVLEKHEEENGVAVLRAAKQGKTVFLVPATLCGNDSRYVANEAEKAGSEHA